MANITALRNTFIQLVSECAVLMLNKMCAQLEDSFEHELYVREKCETLESRWIILDKNDLHYFNRNCQNCCGLFKTKYFILLRRKPEAYNCRNGADNNFFSKCAIDSDDIRCNCYTSSRTAQGFIQNNLNYNYGTVAYDGSLSVCDFSTNIEDCFCKRRGMSERCSKFSRFNLINKLSLYLRLFVSLYMCLLSHMCLYFRTSGQNLSKLWQKLSCSYKSSSKRRKYSFLSKLYKLLFISSFASICCQANAYPNEFNEDRKVVDKINLEQSIAAVFNKVAYGSTTKRSIPDNSYPVTTLATPLLTTYRYSDGSEEWLRVDVKSSDIDRGDYEEEENRSNAESSYGSDLEKDHGLPTSAPAADILKNNNNRNYNNPNRYNNDRLRPEFEMGRLPEQVTENVYKTTTSYNVLRNVRPTKSIYSKAVS